MTMVAACRFPDGGVVIADTRATWAKGVAVFQDTLQKVIPLAAKIGVAFSGDVAAAEIVIRELRRRMRKKPSNRLLHKLAAELPRIARHYYRLHVAKARRDDGLALVLFGVTEAGKIGIWGSESPHFESRHLGIGYLVVGTGKVVESYLKKHFDRLCDQVGDLKGRADAMIIGFEEELQRTSEPTVGGLFQPVLLDAKGIRPLTYGFFKLDPEGSPEAKEIRVSKGRWTQANLATGTVVELEEPALLLSRPPRELRLHEFRLPTPKEEPKWHLTYFLTCLAASIAPERLAFNAVMSIVAVSRFV